MKLLILTQKVDINDDILGFFHGWIAEFAKHCEKVTVICLFKGEYDLPENVRVLSLGKEQSIATAGSKVSRPQGASIRFLRRIIYIFKFYRYIISERRNYNKVFIHMNAEYVVLGGLFWKAMNKKIGLWYTHKSVNLKLRIAERLAEVIFTASPESFRLPSKKVQVLGHGINIEQFAATNHIISEGQKIQTNEKFKIITIGRISPVKDYETLIKAVEILFNEGEKLKVEIIGGPGRPEQEKYLDNLKKMVAERKLEQIIDFVGSVPNREIANYLSGTDLFVNMSQTGSIDKAVLEAMAAGVPVVTGNEAFVEIFDKYADHLLYKSQNSADLAKKIIAFSRLSREKKAEIISYLYDLVERDNNLTDLVKKILAAYGQNDETERNRSANIKKYKASREKIKFATQPGKIVKTELFKRRLGNLVKPGEKILDIGGGAGVWADTIRSENITQDIYALDISEDVLKERNPNDKTFVGDMEKMPFADASFDRAMFFASLHHVGNTTGVLKDAWRVVKKEGYIFLWEPISFKMRLSGRRIEPVNDGVEYRLALPYLFFCLDSLSGRRDYVYYEGFIKRWLPAGNITLLRLADKIEEMINKIAILRYLAGWLSQSVMIVIQKS